MLTEKQMRIAPKIFEYKGYECEIKESPLGTFGLGYLKLPKGHKYYGVGCDYIPVKCHGGLTFGKEIDGKWVIGFDCGHYGDAISHLKEDDKLVRCPIECKTATFKDNEYIENEIKSIVDQLLD